MSRITDKDIESLCEKFNKLLEAPLEFDIGHYSIYHAYGKVALHKIINKGGGCTEVFGLTTRTELYNSMSCFMAGYQLAKEA